MTKPLAMVIYASAIAISFLSIDKPLAEYMLKLSPKTIAPWLKYFTQLGSGIIYVIGFLAAALIFRYLYKNRLWEMRAWFLWSSVVFCSTICLVLKIFLGRARPDMWFGWHYYGFYGLHTDSIYWSFPSGHTATIMSVVFGLSVIFPRYGLWYILFGFLVAVSRILLIQHYLSDVLMASWLALVSVGLVRYVFQKKLLTEKLFKSYCIANPSEV
jgi:membrane-associated phospholipid phosphatase